MNRIPRAAIAPVIDEDLDEMAARLAVEEAETVEAGAGLARFRLQFQLPLFIVERDGDMSAAASRRRVVVEHPTARAAIGDDDRSNLRAAIEALLCRGVSGVEIKADAARPVDADGQVGSLRPLHLPLGGFIRIGLGALGRGVEPSQKPPPLVGGG